MVKIHEKEVTIELINQYNHIDREGEYFILTKKEVKQKWKTKMQAHSMKQYKSIIV